MNNLPPIEKIHEAYSAVADQRVLIDEENKQAKVTSSNGEKNYTVTWNDGTYTANDSATYWQGYPGYTVIAVLMLQGKLTLDREVAALFDRIDWTALNKQYKGDYTKAVDAIIQERQYDAGKIGTAVGKVYEELKELAITVKRGSHRPAKKAAEG